MLGIGNTTSYSSPKQVGSLTSWSQVVAGASSSFSIKTDGTLWAWGRNGQRELGLGNATNYSSPKQVGSLTSWLQVAAGYYAGVGITS
jgi:alpha-tubulin suppressor-like RCC1 family protein